MADEPIFPGFTQPTYTQTPNDLFDVLLRPGTLTEAELRVLLYIIRRTFGFSKDADAISLAQLTEGIVTRDGRRLDYGAGVARSSASRAVQGLERKGMITVTRHRDPQQGDAINTYALRWASNNPAPDPRRMVTGGLHGATGGVAPQNSPSSTSELSGVAPANPQKKDQNKAEQEGDIGLALAAVLSPYGGAWPKEQERAARLCAARGWTPAQLGAALAARKERDLRAKLTGLEGA